HLVSFCYLASSLRSFQRAPATHTFPLSLHDALPISRGARRARAHGRVPPRLPARVGQAPRDRLDEPRAQAALAVRVPRHVPHPRDRKSTRLNSSHVKISYAVFCLKKKKNKDNTILAG